MTKPSGCYKAEVEKLFIAADQGSYEVGGKAKLKISSPFAPFHGVLVLTSNSNIIQKKAFASEADSCVVAVDIEDYYFPNVNAFVYVSAATTRKNDKGEKVWRSYFLSQEPLAPNAVALAEGSIDLKVSLSSRELSFAVEPEEAQLEPGGETNVVVKVTDKDGKPKTSTEIALVVVDESILAIT